MPSSAVTGLIGNSCVIGQTNSFAMAVKATFCFFSCGLASSVRSMAAADLRAFRLGGIRSVWSSAFSWVRLPRKTSKLREMFSPGLPSGCPCLPLFLVFEASDRRTSAPWRGPPERHTASCLRTQIGCDTVRTAAHRPRAVRRQCVDPRLLLSHKDSKHHRERCRTAAQKYGR